MGIEESLIENWYIIVGLIIIFVLYIYKNRSKHLEKKNKNDIELIIEGVIFILLIVFLQDKLFSEHGYFLISLPIFIPVWVMFIIYILSKHDIILIESRQQGEKFYEMGLIPEDSGIKEKLVLSTGILVHRMDRGFWETLEHFGNPSSPFKNVGDRVKFCDFFNGTMVYTPENPLLNNIMFTASQTTWITFKKVIPDIMKTNLMLTDLVDYKIQFHLNEMRENFPHALIGTEEQYKHVPFDLDKSIEEKIKQLQKEHRKNVSEKEEKPIQTKNEGDSDSK